MRNNIYYWKCDSPHTAQEKCNSFFKDKYDRADLADAVRTACRVAFGGDPVEATPLRVDGNHIAFRVAHGGQKYFFRADDGEGDDDYMLAESALMRLAADNGVPVPRVFHTDVSRAISPFRFQIMECRHEPCLDVHHKNGSLNLAAVGTQLGACLRRIHSVRLDGFGFMDTELLSRTGKLRGLDPGYADYFHKRLGDHLGYLRRHDLLSPGDSREVERLFERHEPRLRLAYGVLTHRDMALWNVLGTPDCVTAVIDWDDAVSGDPADDLGVLRCFYDEDLMGPILQGYWGGETFSDDFESRTWLHMLRNMIWKTMLRHSLGYFNKGADFFVNTSATRKPLREVTLERLNAALEKVRGLEAL